MQLAEDSQISNTRFQKDVVDAMIRQPYNNTTIPFSDHNIPGIIHASDYDMGKIGYAYDDEDFADYHVATNEFEAWKVMYLALQNCEQNPRYDQSHVHLIVLFLKVLNQAFSHYYYYF